MAWFESWSFFIKCVREFLPLFPNPSSAPLSVSWLQTSMRFSVSLKLSLSLSLSIYIYIYIYIIFTNPSVRAGYDTRSIFKRSLKVLNSEFFFSYTICLTKAEETSLPYYLPIAGEIIIGFIPFPRVLVLCEMQSVLSRIWTRVAVSISYDVHHGHLYTYIDSQERLWSIYLLIITFFDYYLVIRYIYVFNPLTLINLHQEVLHTASAMTNFHLRYNYLFRIQSSLLRVVLKSSRPGQDGILLPF